MRRRRAHGRTGASHLHLSRRWAGPVLAGGGLAAALGAQATLDGGREFWFDSALLYAVAIVAWWLALRRETVDPDTLTPVVGGPRLGGRRLQALVGGLACVAVCAVAAPALARSGPAGARGLMESLAVVRYPEGWANNTNALTPVGLSLWLVGSGLVLWALADRIALGDVRARLWSGDALNLRITRPTLAVLAIMALAVGLRFYHLSSVPLEMTSDHTEKLLDIGDILSGARPVYMPRNAGREPLEFYWMAALVALGLPLSFMTLKIGMAIVSALTVPAMYWLGKRASGTEVGLLAALAIALSPWHLQITRAGLRIAFAPLFVALTLGFLYVALQTGRRNAWLALGVCLGAGMYGYSAFRPMAFLVALAVAAKIAWDAVRVRRTRDEHTAPAADPPLPAGAPAQLASDVSTDEALVPADVPSLPDDRVRALIGNVSAAIAASVLVAAPLIRFALDQPETFWGRTLTRATGAEVPLANPPLVQLLVNWKQALLMFNATSDSAWFQSPPGRPALETVTGALLVLGVVTAVHRLLRGRWHEPLLLLSVPIMLVASVLALAFPDEVPHLARASGALPAAMVLAVLPLPVVASAWRRSFGRAGTAAALALFAALFAWAGHNAAERYFVEYRDAYNQSTHPTQEGAAIARGFLDLGGDLDHVYLVGWAHGWDYRALGAHMGDLHWNGLLWGAAADGSDAVEIASTHVDDPAPKLYFVGGDRAQADLARLKQLYPAALVAEHDSAATRRTFWTVYVPGTSEEAARD